MKKDAHNEKQWKLETNLEEWWDFGFPWDALKWILNYPCWENKVKISMR